MHQPPPTPGSPNEPTQPPASVPGYEVLRELGRGGMGVVYLARHLALDRLVALKMLGTGAHAGAEQLARFRREGRALARLRHPNIVAIDDAGDHGGLPYLAMEYVKGGSLADRLASGPLPIAEAAALVATLAEAVHYAHGQGLLHRDLKPANVLLTTEGHLKIADFGLARLLDGDDRLTYSGAVVGTPAYMAPEQAAGLAEQLGPHTDVWALGVILYECLTGRRPFKGATMLETLDRVRTRAPVPPRQLRPELSPGLEEVCLNCLQKQPARRYPTARALAEALRKDHRAAPVRTRRRFLLAAATAAPVAALGLWLAQRGPGGVLSPSTLQGRAPGAPPRHARRFRTGPAVKPPGGGMPLALAFSPGGQVVAVLTQLGVQLIDPATGEALPGSAAPPFFTDWSWLGFGPEGKFLAVAGSCRAGKGGQGAYVWAPPGDNVRPLVTGLFELTAAALAPDGHRLALAGGPVALPVTGPATEVQVFDPATGERTATCPHPGAHTVAFTPDGQSLVTGGSDGVVRLWDAASGEHRHDFRHDADKVCLAFGPGGRLLAVGQQVRIEAHVVSGATAVWDVATHEPAVKLDGKWFSPVGGVAFSPSGELLATSEGQKVRLWDVRSGKEQKALPVRFPAPGELRFLPDGRTLALWGYRSLRLWETTEGQDEPDRVLNNYALLTVADDFSRAAGSTADGTVQLWEIEWADGPA